MPRMLSPPLTSWFFDVSIIACSRFFAMPPDYGVAGHSRSLIFHFFFIVSFFFLVSMVVISPIISPISPDYFILPTFIDFLSITFFFIFFVISSIFRHFLISREHFDFSSFLSFFIRGLFSADYFRCLCGAPLWCRFLQPMPPPMCASLISFFHFLIIMFSDRWFSYHFKAGWCCRFRLRFPSAFSMPSMPYAAFSAFSDYIFLDFLSFPFLDAAPVIALPAFFLRRLSSLFAHKPKIATSIFLLITSIFVAISTPSSSRFRDFADADYFRCLLFWWYAFSPPIDFHFFHFAVKFSADFDWCEVSPA